MTQHDKNMANQGAAAFRSDLNNFATSEASNNSGASAPSTTFAYMFWADSTNKLGKYRDSGDSTFFTRVNLDTDMVVTKTGAYTTTVADYAKVILCNAGGGAFTVTLLAAATATEGHYLTLKKTDSSTNAVTIDGNASETIDGATTIELTNQYESVTLYCDGANWHIVNKEHTGATQAQQETATSSTVFVTPGVQQYHPSAAKAWLKFNGTGTPAISASYNITSITDNGVGNYTININTDFSSANYAVAGFAGNSSALSGIYSVTGREANVAETAGTYTVGTLNDATFADLDRVHLVFYGDQ